MPPVDLDECPPGHRRLIFQHTSELAPPGIGEALPQGGAPEGGEVERLDIDRLALTDQPGAQLVMEIPARVGDPCMPAGQSASSFLLVLRTFLLAAHVALRAPQRPLSLTEPAGVGDLLTRGQSGEAREAQVDPNRAVGGGQKCLGHLHRERSMITAGTVEDDRDAGRLRRKWTRPADADCADLWQPELPVAQDSEVAIGREPDRLVVMLALELGLTHPQVGHPRCACSLDLNESPEVVAVSAMQVGNRLLKYDRRDLGQPPSLRGSLCLSRHQP